MIKSSISRVLPLALGLSLLPLGAQAALDSTLRVEVKGLIQNKRNFSGSKESGSVREVRVDTKQLIKLSSQQLRRSFPSGSQLFVLPNGQVKIVDARNNELADVSRFIKAKYVTKNPLYHGSANLSTGQESSKLYYRFTLQLNFPSLKGKLAGNAIETYSVGKVNRDGIQVASSSTNIGVNGTGRLEYKPAFYDGNLYLKGRQAVIVR